MNRRQGAILVSLVICMITSGCSGCISGEKAESAAQIAERQRQAELEEKRRQQERYAIAIRRVIGERDRIAKEGDAEYEAVYQKTKSAEKSAITSLRSAIGKMAEIDLAGCPPDFQMAFLEFVNANIDG